MELIDPLEAVLGVRGWEAREDGRLCSVFWPGKWEPGVNQARCNPAGSMLPEPHDAPGQECGCGLFACSDMNWRDPVFYERPDIVIGTIAAWGRIAPEVDGFRAEYARLLAVGASPEPRVLERRAAVRYGVPLVAMPCLADHGAAHARPTDFARPMSGAVILVVDCGAASLDCIGELRAGLHQLIDRLRGWQIDMIVCGAGAFVVPLIGECDQRERQLHAAVDQLVCDGEGPALARGLERARGGVLWAHRRWSIEVVLISPTPPEPATAAELRCAHRDGVRVVSVCPTPDGGWDRRWGEQIPVVAGELAAAVRDVAGRLEIRSDQWPADWTRRQLHHRGAIGGVIGAARAIA